MTSPRPAEVAGLSERLLLIDGAPIAVRVLGPEDREAFLRLHDELPARDRWLRFLGGGAGYLRDAADDVLGAPDSLVLGAFTGGELVGVVHVAPLAAAGARPPDGAEIAVAVSHAVQARGVGTLLLEQAARASRLRGLSSWTALVLTENAGMLTVLDDLGLPLTRRLSAGVSEIDVDLASVDDPGSRFAFAVYEREVRADRASLDAVLRPDSVAVVGAGRRHGSVGRALLDSLVAGGYRGRLMAVNPHADAIGPVRCYPSVEGLPQVPRLVVVCTPAAAVPALAESCGRAGVAALVVITAGLSPTESAALRDAVRRHGMRLVGPNCLGVACGDLDATFLRGPVPRGHVGLAVQSGGVAIALTESLRRLGLGFSSLVSIGDRYDVSSNDLLRCWAEDDQTRVAVVHVESFGNPRAFSRVARRLSARVPVLAVRAASSEAGARAAASHTAASATPAVRRDAVFEQAGVIALDGLGELVTATAALSWCPLPRGRRVAVLSNAGGAGVIAADACVRRGLAVPLLSPGTRAQLAALLPDTAAVAGPVDTTATVSPATFASCLQVLLADPDLDAVLAVSVPTALGDPGTGVGSAFATAVPDRPVVHVDLGGAVPLGPLRPASDGVVEEPDPAGLRLTDPDDGALALAVLARRARRTNREPGHPLSSPVDLAAVGQVVSGFLADRPEGGWLDPEGCWRLLAAADVPCVPAVTVPAEPDAVVAAARAAGGPVALKAVADGVLHKSRAGGVRLGVRGDDAVRAAVTAFSATFGEALREVSVQPMADPGSELLVGLTAGPEELPLLTLGLGGTDTDLVDRRWHRLVPLDDADVVELVDCLPWSSPAAARLDRGAVETVVARVARLAELVPQIAEMDLNPVLCTAGDARAVDVRIRLVPRT